MKLCFKWMSSIHLLAFSSLILISQPGFSADPPTIGQIVWVKGTVKAMLPNKPARMLQRRSPIYEKDMIVTDKTSTGEIVFTDNSIVALREDTEFQIDTYQFGKNVPADKSKYVAKIVKGGFRTITGLIPKNNPDNYEVNTPVATIAVQGTKFSVVYRGQLWVKYGSGRPCVKNAQGTLCLSAKNVFANVPTATSAPVRADANTAAAAFQGDVEITPSSFNPNATPGGSDPSGGVGPGGTGGGPGGTGGTGGGTGGGTKEGVVSGFCIG